METEKAVYKLDFDVKINENTVNWYMGLKKQTETGLFLNFSAMCPIKFKSGLAFCMLHRAKLICSSDLLFIREVDIVKSLFSANNYHAHFFDKVLRKFLTLSSPLTQENKNSDECETCLF